MSKIVTTQYSSELTQDGPQFCQTGDCMTPDYFYRAFRLRVTEDGSYSFKSNSSMNTYGYIYNNSFYASDPSTNIIAYNDDDGGNSQFLLNIYINTVTTYILVVTTYSHNVTGPFSIIATGLGSVEFSPIGTSVPVSLLGTKEIIYGIYNTTAGGDSTPSTVGQSRGNYLPNGEPKKACDNDTSTTYLNFGNCDEYENTTYCGLKTGLYMTPERGTSMVVGLQLCTGNDFPDSDPIRITLEGTNEPANNLTLGFSWTLIYDGSSGLDYDPGRATCGEKEFFSNSVEYTSYRILVTEKRGADDSVQYSELRLFGF